MKQDFTRTRCTPLILDKNVLRVQYALALSAAPVALELDLGLCQNHKSGLRDGWFSFGFPVNQPQQGYQKTTNEPGLLSLLPIGSVHGGRPRGSGFKEYNNGTRSHDWLKRPSKANPSLLVSMQHPRQTSRIAGARPNNGEQQKCPSAYCKLCLPCTWNQKGNAKTPANFHFETQPFGAEFTPICHPLALKLSCASRQVGSLNVCEKVMLYSKT